MSKNQYDNHQYTFLTIIMPKIAPRSFFPKIFIEEFTQIKNTFSKSKHILLVSHRSPDGDTIGCNIALKLALESQGKKITSACADPIPTNLQFLPKANRFTQELKLKEYDCITSVDCGSTMMTKFPELYPNFLKKSPFINIDHHNSNNNFGTINLVDNKAATAIIIYHLLHFIGAYITPDIATCLLTGLYFDTGSFMHPSTNQEVFQIASDLISKGGNFRRIVKNLFHSQSINQLHLWGDILQRVRVNKNKIAVSLISKDDLKKHNATTESLSGIIDFLNMVPEGKLSILLTEDNQGNIKASCRTQNKNIDVSKLAQLFGGGGHKKAAGFSIKGRIKEDLM